MMSEIPRFPPRAEAERTSRDGRSTASLLRWAPLGLVGIALVLGYAFGLHEMLSPEELRESEAQLSDFVARNALAAAATYVLVYIAAVALSFPGASILTAAGGFMFGCVAGGLLALVSAAAGATLIFLIARGSLGGLLAERAGPRLQRLRQGFAEDGFSYLLFLRLAPIFPFWIVNLAAGLFGMRLLPYVVATAIGIVPGTFALAYFGQELESAVGPEGSVFHWKLFLGLALLGLLALVPVVVRKWRGAGPGGASN